ncbi:MULTISPECIES: 50S ribosomal protein L11 methyltransferase [Bacillaceae]|uniref:Ribosomal protein L11 methyltransferase n=2 Tax=Bacillaceae TaxID=186817 RepID=A0A9D5DU03_9BACI|nr:MULTISPECIES: 50S ribosomal protein L11 methyltransferase [Bacillaceae]KQL58021.1 ribosomal protein L11 methyltransferase [Alkalicoccobacillus plakortidis]MBG9785682.1 ribosomal protein L11 methyltransferase [Shouchella lehensis]TES48144.1 50S ribosomal protein L11 methyltransferase [Shouchella lehensis]
MKWAEFRVHTTQEAVEPVSNILHEEGAAGVAIEDPKDLVTEWSVKFGEVYELSPDDYPTEGVMVKAYFPMNDAFERTIAEVEDRIKGLVAFDIPIAPGTTGYVEVNDDDWANAWKKYYHPVKVTDQIVIVPTWEDYHKKDHELIIELDPGMAFGTGTHPTTVLSLQALEESVKKGDAVIDVGTGSGVLALAAWKLGAERIHAYDLDDVAVTSARENFKLNDAENKIQIAQNNLLNGIEANSAHVVVANILAEVIVTFTDDAYRVVKPGGTFITSGIIERKEQLVKDKIEASGFTITAVQRQEGWVAIIAKKVNE